ncbi:MAG: hypothetical protein H0X66_22485 [Verrucomicrobia bacterium]|jgi:hypothetical protein|nr:hypothetical protein [Verrucomicrobiota bacterium]
MNGEVRVCPDIKCCYLLLAAAVFATVGGIQLLRDETLFNVFGGVLVTFSGIVGCLVSLCAISKRFPLVSCKEDTLTLHYEWRHSLAIHLDDVLAVEYRSGVRSGRLAVEIHLFVVVRKDAIPEAFRYGGSIRRLDFPGEDRVALRQSALYGAEIHSLLGQLEQTGKFPVIKRELTEKILPDEKQSATIAMPDYPYGLPGARRITGYD